MLHEHPVDQWHGQSHDIEVTAFNFSHVSRCDSLDRISSGPVEWFPTRGIVPNLRIGHRTERHLRRFAPHILFAFRRNQANARSNRVHAVAQQAQHANCIFLVGRLFQQVLVREHDGVGAQDEALRKLFSNSCRLVAGQTLRVQQRHLARAGRLRNVGGLYSKRDTGIAQKFGAAGRGRSQNDHRRIVYVKRVLGIPRKIARHACNAASTCGATEAKHLSGTNYDS